MAVHRFNDAEAHWYAVVLEQFFLMPEEHLGGLLERRESLPAQLIDPLIQLAQGGSFVTISPQPVKTQAFNILRFSRNSSLSICRLRSSGFTQRASAAASATSRIRPPLRTDAARRTSSISLAACCIA